MIEKWKVCQTKSKGKPRKRWLAWRVRSKKHTGKVFDHWQQAMRYAYLMAWVENIMDHTPVPVKAQYCVLPETRQEHRERLEFERQDREIDHYWGNYEG